MGNLSVAQLDFSKAMAKCAFDTRIGSSPVGFGPIAREAMHLGTLNIRSSIERSNPLAVFIGLAAAIVLIGTGGYMWIENWTFWRSLFFTLVTLTTVGYGDYGISEAGERFTAVLMVVGIATITLCVGQAGRHLTATIMHPERRMFDRASSIRDHVIICGFGRVGEQVARMLEDEGCPVVVLDNDESHVSQARDAGLITMRGDATDDLWLHRAGIDRANAVAIVSGDDAVNIVITLSARAIRPDMPILARAERDQAVIKLQRAGATHVISLARQGSRNITDLLLRPNVARLLGASELDDNGVHVCELHIEAGSVMAGQCIRQIGERHRALVFVGLKCGAGAVQFRPPATTIVQAGDTLLVVGEQAEIAPARVDVRAAA